MSSSLPLPPTLPTNTAKPRFTEIQSLQRKGGNAGVSTQAQPDPKAEVLPSPLCGLSTSVGTTMANTASAHSCSDHQLQMHFMFELQFSGVHVFLPQENSIFHEQTCVTD